MNASTRLNTLSATEEATRAANVVAPVVRVRTETAGNDATVAEAPVLRNEIESWARNAGSSNDFGDADRTGLPYPGWPGMYELYVQARANRSAALGKMIVAAFDAVVATMRQSYARYRQYRATRVTYDELSGLDDHTLRDLGMSRDEILSVAAETTGLAEQTRVRVRQAAYGLPDFSDA
jgi:uncharacterized protein YjiS (DUF1127 family)